MAPGKGDRLQKILARGGLASRRHAEDLITGGHVRVNGRVVTELGTRADPRRDRIEVDGTRVVAEKYVYLVMHKPRGVVSTMSDPEGRPTVRELVGHVDARLFPVGRLDFATSGVLLATNDGAFSDGLLHPKRAVPKTYVVKVSGNMKDEDLDQWRGGVELDDGKTLPADVSLIRHEPDPGGRMKTWFEVTIREGRNQQIRRMGETTGFPVMRLSRTSFAGITSEDMRPGAVRSLTYHELSDLKKTYGVPRSIPGDIEPNMSKAQPRAPWRRKTTRTDGSKPARVAEAVEAPSPPRYGSGEPARGSYAPRTEGSASRSAAASSRPRAGDSRTQHARAGAGDSRWGSERTAEGGGGGAREGSFRGKPRKR